MSAMNELRKALAIKEGPFSSTGGGWDQQMRQFLEGKCSMEDVLQLLSELRSNAKQWARPKQKEAAPAMDCWGKEQKASLTSSKCLGKNPASALLKGACLPSAISKSVAGI